MLEEPTFEQMLLRLGLSALLGAVLGFDRERRDKPAGLRTHAMVCLGATAFTLVTSHFMYAGLAAGVQNSDPIRLVDGVVGGIGFLGAGAIIQARGSVRGLTTASTIWVAGAVGLACGIGRFALAGTTVAAALVVLEGLKFVKHRLFPSDANQSDAGDHERDDSAGTP